MDSLKASK